MKTKYEWMNHGEEFEMPDFNKMNPQERLDILYLKAKAELKYKTLKPEGVRPKIKELTHGWILYLNMVSLQHNIDIVVYALQTIDPKLKKKKILKNLKEDKDIAAVLDQLFREGTPITPKKKKKGKKTEGQLKSKS